MHRCILAALPNIVEYNFVVRMFDGNQTLFNTIPQQTF